MKVKINLAKALKIAKANGYDGAEDFETVKKWFEENCVPDKGGKFEVVKTVTVSIAADAGEDVQVVDDSPTETEADDTEDDEEGMGTQARSVSSASLKALQEKARQFDALKAKGKLNGAMAGMFGDTPVAHRHRSDRKAYERKVKAGTAVWDSADDAEAWSSWLRLTISGGRDYAHKKWDEEVCRKANITTSATLGSALIPSDFEARLIDIRKQYGVFEGLVRAVPMARDTLTVPRATGNLTVYSPGEAGTITESNRTYDDVQLIARKRATLATISSELLNDSPISVADDTARDIAWSFAKDVDNRGFNGDGTSTYAGDVGLRAYIKGLSGTIANIAGLVVGAGNAYSELTLANFESVAGRLPAFEGATGQPRWLCHPRFYWEVMARLALASGGVTAAEIEGVRQSVFIGYPVVFAEHMPRTEGNSQVCALFGHYDMGAMFGSVRGMEIAQSEHRYFEQDKIAIRGIYRSAITVHDMGNANATEASRTPGPIVGLITAAS